MTEDEEEVLKKLIDNIVDLPDPIIPGTSNRETLQSIILYGISILGMENNPNSVQLAIEFIVKVVLAMGLPH